MVSAGFGQRKERMPAKDDLRGLSLNANSAENRWIVVQARGLEKMFLMCVSTLRRAVRPTRSTACE